MNTKKIYTAKNIPATDTGSKTGVFFQPKLTVNDPGDTYEKEADAMAEKIMHTPIPEPISFSSSKNIVNRQCAECEDEKKNELQRKETSEKDANIDSEAENYISNLDGSGQPLPSQLRNFYEPRFGSDFSQVRIHTDSAAAGSAQAVNALAYTKGSNIVFNSGQYEPGSDNGKRLLAHELTHVLQQNGTTELPAVQKRMDDEHNLQSENFSGDGVLEGCYDGETMHYQKSGKRGEPVRKIQEALIQLGYELPVYGVDGIFKQETDRAVRAFQRDHELSADGIVGPITIAEMDSLLPQKTQPVPPEPFPPEPPNPTPVCTTDETGTELPIQTKRDRAISKTSLKAQPSIIQRKHLTMRESMDEFSKKVNSSKSSDPTVTSRGQFYWSKLAGELIGKELGGSFTMLNPIMGKVGRLANAIENNDTKEIAKLMKEIPKDIEDSGVSNAPDLIKMFLPANAESPLSLWAKFDKAGQVPADFAKKHTNFNAWMQLQAAEKTLCWSMAEFIIKRFQKQGGFTDIDKDKKGKTQPSFSASPSRGATRHFEWAGNKTKGDVVNYDRGSLSSAIKKIKSAIDDGFTPHTRVVSGVNFGIGLSADIKKTKGVSPAPKPVPVSGDAEHSLVIIGYDDVSDEFLFWDPDSIQSSFNGRVGFGVLHFTTDRYTTAKDEADLLVNENGSHDSGQKRYQILTVSI